MKQRSRNLQDVGLKHFEVSLQLMNVGSSPYQAHTEFHNLYSLVRSLTSIPDGRSVKCGIKEGKKIRTRCYRI